MKKTRAIDLETMPRHFDVARAEQHWAAVWEREGYYHYDPNRPREETFAIDTPPPTVSGSLHIGHVFSYAHTDMVARYQRMRGKNIFYPMGWDDNGLPTERRVQNLYHVQCDPHLPYEPDLDLTQATAKQRKKPRRAISRLNFIELCHDVTQQDEQAFKALWQRIGLSVDWRQEYATIGDRARQIAQLSFLDLFEKGHVYMSEEPIMWDVTFQTAVAQAEVKERDEETAMHEIAFGIEGERREIVIATTRPELLPACVGVTAHPDDGRYRDLFGKRAVTPLFAVPVPIFASDAVDPEKGTGIVMVCTFGDATDVAWWHAQRLALRQIVGRDGRLLAVVFGEPGWESHDAERANRVYERLAGLPLKAARKRIVALLGEAEDGANTALRGEPEAFVHAVKFYEKGAEPLEIIPARQWMVRLLDKKDDLLRFGDQVAWHPAFMQTRFDIWTENLLYDWTISRQRYFGVSIPVWYPLDEDGEPDYDRPIVALPAQLPVDPMVATPPGYDETQRDRPGGFTGEADVFDTWFTSSMSPQVTSGWVLDPQRHARLFPFDLRPQAHEIIRTWAFYTIAKSMLHERSRPWRHALISGWVLATDKQKMSKSQGNVLTPDAVLDRFTVDGVRYWAANVRYGVDTVLDENMLKIGKRLVTKLFNAGKFVYAQAADTYSITQELDRAFAHDLGQMIEAVTPMMDAYEGAQALSVIEDFFWRQFTDTYLELVKTRARGEAGTSPEAAGSAVAGLRLGMNVLLRLFAPFLPYITEEVWSWIAAEETGYPSIHRAPWPGPTALDSIAPPDDAGSLRTATACLAEIRKHKADAAVSVGRPIDTIVIAAEAATLDRLRPVAADVMDAARAQCYTLAEKPSVPPGTFEVVETVFV